MIPGFNLGLDWKRFCFASGIPYIRIFLECQGSPTDLGVLLVARVTNGAEKEMLQVSTLPPQEETIIRSNSIFLLQLGGTQRLTVEQSFLYL